jgi:ribonuclease P protein component
LKTNREFNTIYKQATKSWHTPYFVIFFKKSDSYQVAFVASKKIGNAVSRNRAKRLLRANFISICDELSEGSYIFVAKKAILDEDFTKIHKTFKYALKKVSALKQI